MEMELFGLMGSANRIDDFISWCITYSNITISVE